MTKADERDAQFRAAERPSIRYLDALRHRNPDDWVREVTIRRTARILATTEPDSPIYDQALKEWRIARGIDDHYGRPIPDRRTPPRP